MLSKILRQALITLRERVISLGEVTTREHKISVHEVVVVTDRVGQTDRQRRICCRETCPPTPPAMYS